MKRFFAVLLCFTMVCAMVACNSNYGVKKYSSIGKEWYEQVDALEDYCIGKTVSDVSSMQMKEVDGRQGVPAAAELSSSCTISCTQFIDALKKAEKNVM